MPRALLAGSVTLVALVLLAFWPGYLSKPRTSLDAYTHFHAAVATVWLALLVLQPTLVVKRHLHLHRRIGRASLLLAPAFVLSAVLLAHFRFSRMDASTFANEAYTLYLPLSAAILFAVSVTFAILYRATPSLHSRFMACTALLLVDPIFGRVLGIYVVTLPQFWHYQLITFGIELAVLLWLVRTLGPEATGRRTFSRFAVFYASILILWFFVPHTPPWLVFATWFRQQPIT